MDIIQYEDFAKIDLRTAVVKEASNHPKADRLLVLKVEMGTETRQIIAGVREHYKAEDMVGKTITVVANLAPKEVRGVESHGMLLAVKQDDGVLSLLTTDKVMASGLKVG